MNTEIDIIATLVAKPGKVEALKNVFVEQIKGSRAEEGNICYILLQDKESPDTLVVFERWKSQEAIDIHNKAQHFIKFGEQSADLVASRSVNLYKPVE